ncbi:hypothetical protein HK103_004456 [Boothiomyces macroporosus]|uniref:Uncharacterized protein n=1 Tax=Boothiomyces macroporosus TaxID=261099 RepID=A0AAD5Y892_9FUNG|nr:hypothetical protein HK103_004456 [Boothiomyces macroporosus]
MTKEITADCTKKGDSTCLSAPQNDDTTEAFSLKLDVTVRKYIGQHKASAEHLGEFSISFNTQIEFYEILWTKFSSYLNPQPRFDGQRYVHGKDPLSITDIGMYIHMKKSGKQFCAVDKFAVNILQKYSDTFSNGNVAPLEVSIYRYSAILDSLREWTKFKQVIDVENRERAAAAEKATINAVTEKLKEKHGLELEGNESIWKLWASRIVNTHDSSTMDQAILLGPPKCLARMFQRRDTDLNTVASLAKSEAVALKELQEIEDELKNLQNDFEVASERFTSVCDNFRWTIKQTNSRLKCLAQSTKKLKRSFSAMSRESA